MAAASRSGRRVATNQYGVGSAGPDHGLAPRPAPSRGSGGSPPGRTPVPRTRPCLVGVEDLRPVRAARPGCAPGPRPGRRLHLHRGRRRHAAGRTSSRPGTSTGDQARRPGRGRRRTTTPSSERAEPHDRPQRDRARSAARRRSARARHRASLARGLSVPSRARTTVRTMPIPTRRPPLRRPRCRAGRRPVRRQPDAGQRARPDGVRRVAAGHVRRTPSRPANGARTPGSSGCAGLDDADLSDDERIDRDLALMVLRGPGADARLGRLAAQPRPLRRHRAQLGVFVLLIHRLRPEPELAQAVAARLRGTPGAAASRASTTSTRRWPTRRCCAAALGQIAGRRGLRPVGRRRVRPTRPRPRWCARPARRPRRRTSASASTSRSLVEKASGDWAIGEARYDALLREAEGLGYGTRELRDEGPGGLRRARRGHDATGPGAARHTTTVSPWSRSFNEDHPETPEEMLALYREATDAARAFCVEHDLVTMPEGEHCEVVPSAPFSRAMLAVAHYMQPPPFAPRRHDHAVSATSSCPTRRTARPRSRSLRGWRPTTSTALWSIAVHEAYPGHHWHFAWLSLANAGTAAGARPLRFVFGSTYFVEGWGLYTEDLLREQGFFRDPGAGAVPARLPAVPGRPDHRRHLAAPRRDDDRGGHRLHVDQDLAVPRDRRRPRCCATARGRRRRRPTSPARWRSPGCAQRWLAEARGSLRDFHDLAAWFGPAADRRSSSARCSADRAAAPGRR